MPFKLSRGRYTRGRSEAAHGRPPPSISVCFRKQARPVLLVNASLLIESDPPTRAAANISQHTCGWPYFFAKYGTDLLISTEPSRPAMITMDHGHCAQIILSMPHCCPSLTTGLAVATHAQLPKMPLPPATCSATGGRFGSPRLAKAGSESQRPTPACR